MKTEELDGLSPDMLSFRRGSRRLSRPDLEEEEESEYFEIKPKNQVIPEGKTLSFGLPFIKFL